MILNVKKTQIASTPVRAGNSGPPTSPFGPFPCFPR